MEKQQLDGKTILVTGAANGIGKSVSLALAQAGATIVLLDKNIQKLEQVYDKIELSGGKQPAIYPMDLSGATGKDFDDLAENLSQEFTQLDGLIHNAALLGSLMPMMQFDLEHWNKVMQVNLHAPYFLTRVCFPLLSASNNASILFTTDQVGIHGKAYWGAYAITKAAGDNLMQTLADELEVNTKIRVNSINPGIVATAMRAAAFPGEEPDSIAQATDITQKYVYLMCDDSILVNGQIINAQ